MGSSTKRRILCVFPRYAPSFGTFSHAYPLTLGVRAFMPPQGLLVIAAYVPRDWDVRFVDENIRRATAAEMAWADAIFMSGMHVQRGEIDSINRRAHRLGKTTVLGGPSVSAAPEHYPDVDYLHVGELGDATDELIATLAGDPRRPAEQIRFTTKQRVPLTEFPVPAYEKLDLNRYLLASLQFSSGCPYQCEFCDIPELYGRNPRLKTPEQILAELDALLAHGNPGTIYFVDDNFVGNRKATLALLPHLIEWQRRNRYPLGFSCEATLNIAKTPELLAMMREAGFGSIFCGIETPETEALHAIRKDHNNAMPILEAVRIINSFGMEVISGIIMGLDTDTPETGDRILEFIERSQIPMLTINLLHALPRTPLWRRLAAEHRIVDLPGRETNVEYLMPYEEVLAMWRRCITRAYDPEAVYARLDHNIEHVYPRRFTPPPELRSPVGLGRALKGIGMLLKVLVRIGVFSDYRRVFWRRALPLLRTGRIEWLIRAALVSHHLITFARLSSAGKHNASFYSERVRESVKAS